MNVYWGDCWIDGKRYAVYCTEIKINGVKINVIDKDTPHIKKSEDK